MAITNSICITQTECNKLIIQDSSDWDTIVPLTDITTSSIEVTYDETTYNIDFSDYEEEFEITASSLGLTSLKDGVYTIKVTYTTDEDTYIIEEESFVICNIQCIIDNLVYSISIDNCTDCNKDKKTIALDATLKLDALEASIACGDLTKSQAILDWLNNLLINYNCKNC